MRAVQKLIYQMALSGIEQMDLAACQELLEEAFNEETSQDILLLLDSALNRTDVGESPVEELERLAELVPPAPPEREDVRVERLLQARAAALWDADWQTPMYWELMDVLAAAKCAEYRQSMGARLEKAAGSYQEALANPAELSIEALVGHKLFLDGLEDLRESLEYLESNPSAALKWAEQGNRLLIAVQRFTDRYNPGWVKVRGGIAPPFPVHGGTDVDGTDLYVAAAQIDGETIPGKTRAPFNQAMVSHNGQALVVNDFEMLTDLNVNWVTPDEDNFVHAVYLGPDAAGEEWCVARGHHEGQWVPGKARRGAPVCCIPYGHGEHDCEVYHILIKTE